jgi:glutathione S-transferase
MSKPYRIFGSENSPYSTKVRSYFRYKQIPHEWILRSGETMEEFKKYARLPIVPAVATPDDEGLQDSTPIMEEMERRETASSIHPEDPTLRFLSELLEEFGDEWGNKWMFHYRWAREIDQTTVANRLVSEMMPGAPQDQIDAMATNVRERMSGRGFAVGSNEKTADLIENSFKDGIAVLEKHLENRPYLLGGRPSFADLGLGAQIYQALIDPTAGEILRETAPRTAAWSERLLDPKDEGDFETLDQLAPTLLPLLASEVRFFLAWSQANAEAIAAGAEEMTLEHEGRHWWQTVGGPQKYHAKSLREIRSKYAKVAEAPGLEGILNDAGCKEFLTD